MLDVLARARTSLGGGQQLVHYLAVPPVAFAGLTKALGEHGLAKGARSSRDTFVAARLWTDNARWRGVPFYLRTGKRLAATKQRVSLILREPAGPLAGQLPREANGLSFSLAGDGGIDLSLVVKSPARRWTSTPRMPRSRCPAWTARIPCRPTSG